MRFSHGCEVLIKAALGLWCIYLASVTPWVCDTLGLGPVEKREGEGKDDTFISYVFSNMQKKEYHIHIVVW